MAVVKKCGKRNASNAAIKRRECRCDRVSCSTEVVTEGLQTKLLMQINHNIYIYIYMYIYSKPMKGQTRRRMKGGRIGLCYQIGYRHKADRNAMASK